MREEERAGALARWLDDPSSGPPPELEGDVVEALSALKPELAPPPRVTADDILASLTSGPLADGEAVAPVPTSAEPMPVPAVDVAPANDTRGWWRAVGGAGGLGLLLAVGATLLVILPQSSDLPDLAAPMSRVEAELDDAEVAAPEAGERAATRRDSAKTEAAMPSPSLRPRPRPAPPALAAKPAAEAPAQPARAPAAPPAAQEPAFAQSRDAAPPAGASATPSAAREDLIPELGDEVLVADQATPTALGGLAGGAVGADSAGAGLEAGPAAAPAEADAFADDAVATLDELEEADEEEELARERELQLDDADDEVSADTAAYQQAYKADFSEAADEGGLEAAAIAEERGRPSPASRNAGRRQDKKSARSRSAPAADAAPADVAPEPEPVDDLAGLRAAALPGGAGGGTPSGIDPAVAEADARALADADAAAARGDLRAAADLLAARVVPPASLGQARAVQAARHYLGAGDPSAAAGIAQAGLALGQSPSTDRAWLFVLYGDALQQLGDPAGAAGAYRAAAGAR